MTVDDILLKALEGGGPVTVNDILKHFERRVRIRLNKLRVRGVVVREGRGGAHREFTYSGLTLPRSARRERRPSAWCKSDIRIAVAEPATA
jgi:hypothetical protein